MSCDGWVRGPFGLEAGMGATVPGPRRVLAVAHHLTAGTRLADVLPLLENDRRVQVAYTAPPISPFTRGLTDYLDRLGGIVLPWRQATLLSFDLAIAASHGMLEELHAPVLTLPHGSGPAKRYGRIGGAGPEAARPITTMLPERLVVGGRVVPSALMLPHERHRALLARECPAALPVAVVGGDPCLDRLLASGRYRAEYRRALGVGPRQRLVFVSSTWGPRSLVARCPDLVRRLATELPGERYRVVVALHPHIWTWHGRRSVAAWHTDCLRLGVRLLPPEEGWRAALVAADRVIGDHGSVTYYGAAMGVPAILAAFPEDDVEPGSHIARLGEIAPRLDRKRPLRPQVDGAARAYGADSFAALRDDLSSHPGKSAQILRREMYRLLELPEPDFPARPEPVPLPHAIGHGGAWAA